MNRKSTARQAAEQPGSQRDALLDAAAHLFSTQGFNSTSMRDIAASIGKTPGSLYYHFESKNDLLVAIHLRAQAWAEDILRSAKEGNGGPWKTLEQLCVAHLEALLERPDYAVVVAGTLPTGNARLHRQLIGIRDQWEAIFRGAIDELPLANPSDKKFLRLALFGAMNNAQVWFRKGRDRPAEIARKMVAFMRFPTVA
jgi:AcrR family transcriptional regulator